MMHTFNIQANFVTLLNFVTQSTMPLDVLPGNIRSKRDGMKNV